MRPSVAGLIQDLDAVLWEADPQTFQFTYVSEGAERLLGYPVAEWLAEQDFWARHIHPDDRAEAVTHCLVATREGRDHDFQYRMVARDGSIRWIRDFVRVRVDDQGTAVRLSGILLDTTAQHLAPTRPGSAPRPAGTGAPARILILEDDESHAILAQREVRKAVPECVLLVVANGPDYDKALWEFAPDVILSDHHVPGFGGRDALRLAQLRRPETPFILLTGSLDEETAVEYMKAGASDYVLKNRAARLGLTLTAALERRQQREDRERAEAQYRDIFLGAPLGIARTTPEGQLLNANPELARMLGHDPQVDLASLNVTRDVYLHDDDRTRVIAAAQAGGGVSEFEVQWKKKDGSAIWVQLSIHVARDQNGEVRYLEMFVRDINEQKLLAAQLRQAQRMEAIGQLAGGVAHDFNNILTAILGYAGLLLDELGTGDTRREDVEEIRNAAERGAGLTRQLLAFSRKQVLAVQMVDLNVVVGNIDRMLRRLIGENIPLQLSLAPDLGMVEADVSQIEQVIMNLVVNARDAITGAQAGLISIETANQDLDESASARRVAVVPGPYVVLAVTDTGTGMDAETKSRLFEPFFTTKGPGKGTGLGLATVYGIVRQSGGHIWVYSEVGLGTTMKVYLPRSAATGAPDVVASADTPQRGTETILLVEDEVSVRALAHRALTEAGYTVIRAASGVEGLRQAKDHVGPIDLLLTDVVMPDMGGPELAAHLATLRPTTRVLYMSGYPAGVLEEDVLQAGSHYLPKPFSPDALRRRVRDVLDLPRDAA